VPTAPRDRAPHERARGEHSLNRHGHSRWWRETKLDLRRRVAMRLVADRDYVARLYHCKFGRYPDLATPAGFNEKILAKILGDRRPYLTLFADKLRVRDYVRSVAPELGLPKLYWWSDRAETLPFDRLPHAFALKANHGSGWNILVEDKQAFSRAALVKQARKWLRSDFTIVGREWAYRNVRRAVYAEELLRLPHGAAPPDYKLFVFRGRVRFVQVDRDRFARHTQVLYDERWNPIDGTVAALQGSPMPPPASLATMLTAAQKLSAKVDFVRIDLYDVEGTAYFGELTSSPNKGLSPFRPAALDARFGAELELDDAAHDVPIAYRPEDFSGT
jgi:hypothetical protein